jgi:N6-L-threonylcarbamoyladenine synthase
MRLCPRCPAAAHALHSQIDMHQAYGGVVPELASRDHIRRVLPLTDEVLARPGAPGRGGCGGLHPWPWAGGCLAGGGRRGCAPWALRWANRCGRAPPGRALVVAVSQCRPAEFPFVALLVSGGHTQLMRVDGVGQYELLGETIDDAAGEAFDKSAKLHGPGLPRRAGAVAPGRAGQPAALRCPGRCCTVATWIFRLPG